MWPKNVSLIAKIALDILGKIILICFFHVKYLSICIPKNLTDSSLLSFPI